MNYQQHLTRMVWSVQELIGGHGKSCNEDVIGQEAIDRILAFSGRVRRRHLALNGYPETIEQRLDPIIDITRRANNGPWRLWAEKQDVEFRRQIDDIANERLEAEASHNTTRLVAKLREFIVYKPNLMFIQLRKLPEAFELTVEMLSASNSRTLASRPRMVSAWSAIVWTSPAGSQRVSRSCT